MARAGLLGLACIILVVGVALRDGALLSLLVPLVLLLLFGLLIPGGENGELVMEWAPLDDVKFMEGDRVELTLILRNGKNNGLIHVELRVPDDIVIEEGRRSFPLWMRPGQEVMLRYMVLLPHRGKFMIGPVLVRGTDLLQLDRWERAIDAVIALKVMPIIYDLNRCDLRPSKVRQHSGNVRSRMLGAGSEFYSLRDYAPGDGLRSINWKASARTDALVVNEHESERSGDITLVIDARGETDGKVRGRVLVDREVSAAASLAAFYLRQRDRVGMMVFSDHVELLKPAFGRRQFYRIVEQLTEVRPAGERSSISVRLAMQRFFSPQSLLLYITPLDDEATIQVIKKLTVRGYQVVVVSPSPLRRGDDLADEYEFRLRRLRREDQIFDLRRYCHVIDWDTEEPLNRYVMGVRGWFLRV